MRFHLIIVSAIFCSLFLSASTFASDTDASQKDYKRPTAFAAATGAFVATGICVAKSGDISSAVANNLRAIFLGSVAVFTVSVVWETVAKKVTADDNTPYRFSRYLGLARERVVKPVWENVGYGAAMYYDILKNILSDARITASAYADTLFETPLKSFLSGSDRYCREHGLDRNYALAGEAAIGVADLVLAAIVTVARG